MLRGKDRLNAADAVPFFPGKAEEITFRRLNVNLSSHLVSNFQTLVRPTVFYDDDELS